jgi:hypothetical protein
MFSIVANETFEPIKARRFDLFVQARVHTEKNFGDIYLKIDHFQGSLNFRQRWLSTIPHDTDRENFRRMYQ